MIWLEMRAARESHFNCLLGLLYSAQPNRMTLADPVLARRGIHRHRRWMRHTAM